MKTTSEQLLEMQARVDRAKYVPLVPKRAEPVKNKAGCKSFETNTKLIMKDKEAQMDITGVCKELFGKLPEHIFYIAPFPAPRMTRSDKWKTDPNHPDPKKRQRLCVSRYWAFKTSLNIMCFQQKYSLTEVLNIAFFVEMPESWSKKKKSNMLFTKHQSRPDRDNYLKAFQDSFKGDDGFVYDGRTIKLWSDIPMIAIF